MIHETMYMNILTTQNNVRIKKNYTISPNLTQFLSSVSLHPANLLVLQLGDKQITINRNISPLHLPRINKKKIRLWMCEHHDEEAERISRKYFHAAKAPRV